LAQMGRLDAYIPISFIGSFFQDIGGLVRLADKGGQKLLDILDALQIRRAVKLDARSGTIPALGTFTSMSSSPV
jgi:hypothetical protein